MAPLPNVPQIGCAVARPPFTAAAPLRRHEDDRFQNDIPPAAVGLVPRNPLGTAAFSACAKQLEPGSVKDQVRDVSSGLTSRECRTFRCAGMVPL